MMIHRIADNIQHIADMARKGAKYIQRAIDQGRIVASNSINALSKASHIKQDELKAKSAVISKNIKESSFLKNFSAAILAILKLISNGTSFIANYTGHGLFAAISSLLDMLSSLLSDKDNRKNKTLAHVCC